jgi:hypothetical protein
MNLIFVFQILVLSLLYLVFLDNGFLLRAKCTVGPLTFGHVSLRSINSQTIFLSPLISDHVSLRTQKCSLRVDGPK